MRIMTGDIAGKINRLQNHMLAREMPVAGKALRHPIGILRFRIAAAKAVVPIFHAEGGGRSCIA